MVESLISLLITLCLLALCVYLVIWVCGQIGLSLPAQVVKILWVIVVLVAILMIVRAMPLRLVSIMDGAKNRVASIAQSVKMLPAKFAPWKIAA